MRAALAALAGLLFGLFGCQSSDFNDAKTKGMIEMSPVRLDSEQVKLNQGQVDCGVTYELWEGVNQVSGTRSTAHLLDGARSLKFSDDVAYEPGNRQPFIQVNGEFPLQIDEITSTRDEDKETKIVEGRIGIKVPHGCFPAPLPIMGVKRGNFSQDVLPRLRFKLQEDGWHIDGFVH